MSRKHAHGGTQMAERAAYDYFFNIKWPTGFVCPTCGFRGCYTIRSRRQPLYQCQMCRHQTTLTAGTVLENTRTELRKWRKTMELMALPESVNAVQLEAILQVAYKTAFAMLHKIRAALSDADANRRLTGQVHAGRFRFYMLRNRSFELEEASKIDIVIGGSCVRMGEWSYIKIKPSERPFSEINERMAEQAFKARHVSREHVAVEWYKPFWLKKAVGLLPHVRQLSAWLNPTFKGVSRKYLERYFDEFTFRVNRSAPSGSALSDMGTIMMNNRNYVLSASPHAA